MILLTGGVCVVAHGGVRGCSGGHVWFLLGDMHGFCWGGRGACVVAPGGMRGFCWGACMVFAGGVCVVFAGGICGFCQGACMVFAGGACMVFPQGGMRRIRRDTVNERAVCILLECILVDCHFLLAIVQSMISWFRRTGKKMFRLHSQEWKSCSLKRDEGRKITLTGQSFQ